MVLSDAQILSWLCGAASDEDALWVETVLALEPSAHARVAALRAALSAFSGPPPVWSLPLPGQGRGAAGVVWRDEPVAIMSEAQAAPVLREVQVTGVPDVHLRQVVLLRAESPGAWAVVLPAMPTELVRADAELVRDSPDGTPVLVVSLQMPRAGQGTRWAVALPRLDLPVAWDQDGDDRWAALIQGIDDNSVPVYVLGEE